MTKTSSRTRILSLDLLRGYFLVVILIDHLAHFPGVFEFVTGKGWLWASAAEGFFIISGMMVGLIRGKELLKKPFAQVRNTVWRRALQLYVWAVGLTLTSTAIAMLFVGHVDLKPGLIEGAPLATIVWQSLTFQYVYGWADFLSHYAICMAFAPLALYALHRGWWRQIVAVSLLVWWMRGNNFAAAWQLLFVGGMVAGYYLPRLEEWVSRWSLTTRQLVMRWWLGATVATLTVSVMIVHVRQWLFEAQPLGGRLVDEAWSLQYAGDATGQWFDKITLAPGRIAVAALWFGALYMLARRYEAQLDRWLGWLLIPLGRNSLFVYITQSVVVLVVPLLMYSTTNVYVNFMLNLLMIALIWRITLLYSQERQATRRRERQQQAGMESAPVPTPVASATRFGVES